MNTIGSYKCTCPAGYVSNSAGICEGKHVGKHLLRILSINCIYSYPQTFRCRLHMGLHASLVHVCTVNVGAHALNTPTTLLHIEYELVGYRVSVNSTICLVFCYDLYMIHSVIMQVHN